MRTRRYVPGRTALLYALLAASADAAEPVKVFVLAGQSNMVGMSQTKLWDYQATAPATAKHFAHLRDDGAWLVRDDAFIRFGDRHGPLTVGYGARGRTGVEMEFGYVVAEHFDAPVLLIKTAWGGHDLARAFRPPSAGMPSEEALREELEAAAERVRRNNERRNRSDPAPTPQSISEAYGRSYRQMLDEVRDTQARCATLFPELEGKQLELSGFVWFQGWNDMYGGAETQYAENLGHLINDIRRDLAAPGLPVVVGAMGQNGSKPAEGAMLVIQDAQLEIQDQPGFKDAVRSVRTDVLVDKKAEELFPTWRENTAEWEKWGSDRPYHYLGSAIWHQRIGRAFGEAMVELVSER